MHTQKMPQKSEKNDIQEKTIRQNNNVNNNNIKQSNIIQNIQKYL